MLKPLDKNWEEIISDLEKKNRALDERIQQLETRSGSLSGQAQQSLNPKQAPLDLFLQHKNELKQEIQDTWSEREWQPLHNGRFFMAVPNNSLLLNGFDLEKLTKESLVEWGGHSVVWPLRANPKKTQNRISFTWPEKGGLWISDFNGVHAYTSTQGCLGYFESYWEDLRYKNSKSPVVGVFSTLIKSLLFLKFCQKFMAASNRINEMHVFVMLFDSRNRILTKEDPRFLPFFQEHVCTEPDVFGNVMMTSSSDLLEKTIELCQKLFWYFDTSEDFNNNLKRLFINWGKEALLGLGIPFQEM